MERKLIKQGGGGLTVYLPKAWLDRKGLKEGNKINIAEKENTLVISGESQGKKEKTLEITEHNKHDLSPILTHLYRKGYEKIILNNINNESLKEIKHITNKMLLGFELTKSEGKSCTIENISEPSEDKFGVMMDKIFFLIKETIGLIKEDISDNKFDNFDEVKEIRHNLDKTIYFCRRTIMKETYAQNPVLSWEILTFLMHIHHSAYYLYEYLYLKKLKNHKEMLKLVNELIEYFSLYEKAYKEGDVHAIHKINALKKEIHLGRLIKMIEKAKGPDVVALGYFKEIFRLIQIGTSPILVNLLDKKD